MAAWRALELFNIRPAMSISHVSIILNRFRVLKNMSDTYLLQCNADDDEVAHVLGDCVIVQAAAPITGVLSLFDARKAPQLYIPRRLGDPRNAACQSQTDRNGCRLPDLRLLPCLRVLGFRLHL